MNTVLAIAVSGMQAATRRLEVSARNIANAQSSGALPTPEGKYPEGAPRAYTPWRVSQGELRRGGTTVIESAVSPSDVQTYDPSASYADEHGLVAAPNVDPNTEAVEQVIARYTFAANAQVVITYDRMMKAFFDIKA